MCFCSVEDGSSPRRAPQTVKYKSAPVSAPTPRIVSRASGLAAPRAGGAAPSPRARSPQPFVYSAFRITPRARVPRSSSHRSTNTTEIKAFKASPREQQTPVRLRTFLSTYTYTATSHNYYFMEQIILNIIIMFCWAHHIFG